MERCGPEQAESSKATVTPASSPEATKELPKLPTEIVLKIAEYAFANAFDDVRVADHRCKDCGDAMAIQFFKTAYGLGASSKALMTRTLKANKQLHRRFCGPGRERVGRNLPYLWVETTCNNRETEEADVLLGLFLGRRTLENGRLRDGWEPLAVECIEGAQAMLERVEAVWYKCTGGPNDCRRSKRLHPSTPSTPSE
ncbi:MAG: hypothetical protein Q9162_002435 [Coniocarpon cinnabarinum]